MPSILVVEDDEDLRRVIEQCLKDAGYEVIAVADPMAALDELDRRTSVDLVMADVRFAPGQPQGMSLASMVKWRSPEVRVLLITGHPDLMAMAREDGIPAMLKPIRMPALLKEIGAVLAR